jgi:putative RNA 2'-phosphotransferase
MSAIDLTHLSKTVAHALRHAPWLYELELDAAGWTPVAALLHALRQQHPAWRTLDQTDLEALLARPGKRRFEMKNGRIRALYGHSLARRIEKEPSVPPPRLYHGTAPATARIIRQEGLRPMNRQYVHLSTDRPTAIAVGRRKAPHPVILVVDAAAAHAAGITFYRGNDVVWLATAVPPAYIYDEHGEVNR